MNDYGNSNDIWSIIIVVIIVVFIVFLICRKLVCWYWKINKLVALMEEQNLLLKNIESRLSSSSLVGNKIQKKCQRCKKEVDEDYSLMSTLWK
jgi:hypothetical protein